MLDRQVRVYSDGVLRNPGVEDLAQRRGITVSALVREALEDCLRRARSVP
ncbi:MAG: hypothetical protein ACH36H_06540 [Candidatus Nanopelagicales bacterium]